MEQLLDLKFNTETWVVATPLILMVLDFFTGFLNAWLKKEISSAKMRDGIGKKIAELIYITVAFMLSAAFNIPMIKKALVLYISFMEVISLIENCKKLGVPLPNFLQNKLNNVEFGQDILKHTEKVQKPKNK